MEDWNFAQFIVLLFISFSLVLLIVILTKPILMEKKRGKIIAFAGIFLFPGISAVAGLFLTMSNATTVEFCLSCHEMESYGKSLTIDDEEYFVANHFLNNRLPEDHACYTCHTSYTMFGDVESKIRGLKHLYVHYLGSIPDTIKLYSKFLNRECLHCHSGGKDYILSEAHNETETMLEDMRKDKVSCITAGCHDVAHGVHDFEDLDFWKEEQQ